jgi:hypothetical protein
MNLIQRIAAITGVGFIVVAILGFATTGFSFQMTHVTMESAPKLLGLFPVNPMHNTLHLLIGIWGVIAARRPRAATMYAAISGILYLILAALGFFAPTAFGMLPIGGYDIIMHFALAIILIGFAFMASMREEVEIAA